MAGRVRQILLATATIASLSLLAKLMAMIKESVVAYRFGTGAALDAFVLAYLVPSFLTSVIGGSCATAFIPEVIRAHSKGGIAAASSLLARTSLVVSILLLVGATLVGPALVAALPAFSGKLDLGTLGLARSFTWILLPTIPLVGLGALWSAALNAQRRFFLASLPPFITPAAVMLLLVLAWHSLGVWSVAVGHLLGALIEAGVIGLMLRAAGYSILGWNKDRFAGLGAIWRQFLAAATAAVLMSSTLIVDQVMAAGLGSGNVSALQYASKVTSAVVTIGSVALGTALLPHLSSMVQEREWSALDRVLRNYVMIVAAASVVVTAALVWLSPLIVSVLFRHGAFSEDDARIVATAQRMLLLQIPTFSLGTIAVRLISALNANRILAVGALISVVINVVLNWLLMRRMGLAGIALSTSIVYAVSCAFLWWCAARQLQLARERAGGV